MTKHFRLWRKLNQSFALLFFAITTLSGCTSYKHTTISKEVTVNKLAVKINYGPSVSQADREVCDIYLNEAIKKFNAGENRIFIAYRDDNALDTALIFRLDSMYLASYYDKISAGVMSGVGLIAFPIVTLSMGAPVPFFFFYLPSNVAWVNTSLSPDIAGPYKINSKTFKKKTETFWIGGENYNRKVNANVLHNLLLTHLKFAHLYYVRNR